ncbi:hypothetical protein QGX15_gp134 [Pseudomonas phage psageK4e]|uniref:Uncharacterized protein n=1 Tax=Pseudomonas phage psageK4e TaxID=2875723 RepID=A0AAE8XMK1_9CAUD|nr:hypothetical protein QGX15_gp134 [Pseudomonas phage psageK4e]UAW53561.1 hypothetical protein psageK4e_113 [Pseudomonas phage psageK4e]
MTDPDYVKMLELQVECLARAVINTSGDLVRAGMSEYAPDFAEMIEMGQWGLGLLDTLGINKSEVKDWTLEGEDE